MKDNFHKKVTFNSSNSVSTSSSVILNREHYRSLKRSNILLILLLTSIFLSGCLNNDIGLPDQLLQGMVAGEEWQFKFGNAYRFSSDGKYRLLLMSTNEPGEEPCTIPSPSTPFISMIIPLDFIQEDLPFPIVEESPRFHITNSNNVIATSGIGVRVDAIQGSRLFGYLEAILDEDNSVIGSFEVEICTL